MLLLYGPLPMYRPLAEGVRGADVAQFEQNLRELGYAGFTVDDQFSAATTAAVKGWQRHLAVEPTGVVDATRVVYCPDVVRVAALSLRVGAPATGTVLRYTGLVKQVTVAVPVADLAWAVPGTAVTVGLPGDRTVAGSVAAVGVEASSAGSDSAAGSAAGSSAGGSSAGAAAEATVPVTVSVADQQALSNLERSPVDVRYTAQRRENVLTVPVAALLALAEGGYGLELVEGAARRIVAVETGMVADGRIEVRGAGLAEGQLVGIAA